MAWHSPTLISPFEWAYAGICVVSPCHINTQSKSRLKTNVGINGSDCTCVKVFSNNETLWKKPSRIIWFLCLPNPGCYFYNCFKGSEVKSKSKRAQLLPLKVTVSPILNLVAIIRSGLPLTAVKQSAPIAKSSQHAVRHIARSASGKAHGFPAHCYWFPHSPEVVRWWVQLKGRAGAGRGEMVWGRMGFLGLILQCRFMGTCDSKITVTGLPLHHGELFHDLEKTLASDPPHHRREESPFQCFCINGGWRWIRLRAQS